MTFIFAILQEKLHLLQFADWYKWLKKCILNLKRLTFRKDFTYMIPVYAIFFCPTASIQKRLCRKFRAHKKVTITREWKLMCQIMRSWIKLIYKQHNYFNLLAKAPRFFAKSRRRCYKLHKPGTVSVVSNLLYIRRKSELRFHFLLSCFLISSC